MFFLLEKETKSKENKMKFYVYVPISAMQVFEIEGDYINSEEDAKQAVLAGDALNLEDLDNLRQDTDTNNWEVEVY